MPRPKDKKRHPHCLLDHLNHGRSLARYWPMYWGLYYGEPLRSVLFFIVGINFFQILGDAYSHYCEHYLRFKQITLIPTTAYILSLCCAIWAAYQGWGGIISLVIKETLRAVIFLDGMVLFSSFRWVPIFARGAARWIVHFGSRLLLNYIKATLFQRWDRLPIGHFMGTAALGHYTFSYRLAMTSDQITRQPMTPLLFSVYAHLQFEKGKLSYAFEHTQYWLWSMILILGVVLWSLGADQHTHLWK